MAHFADAAKKLGWNLGKALFTHSNQWGAVLRIDFTVGEHSNSPFINRIICWRQSEQGGIATLTAFGARTDPLK